MASGRSHFLSDERIGAVPGPQFPDDDVNQYRAALGHALRGENPRPVQANMQSMIEFTALNATDMIGIQSRLIRIASVLGRHIPLQKDGGEPSSPPSNMLHHLDVINNTQRRSIELSNSLLAEIEQALGI